MSVDPKKFGLSSSLVEAVNEALKGGQVKLDKNHNGKLDSQDFKILRGQKMKEGPEEKDATNPKQGNSVNPKDRSIGEAMSPKQKAFINRVKTKPGKKGNVYDPTSNFEAPNHKIKVVVSKNDKKETKDDVVQARDKHEAMFKAQMKFHKMGYKVHDTIYQGIMKEEIELDEADDAVAKQIAAKKDAMKKQIQQKIAAKQMTTMQAKANKRISNIHASKCTCSENKKNMSCEVCNSGGKEKITVNPPMREAAELPKKVITKGHEIAKSLIKHRSSVKNPYAVGMATAKKSAGIKEETTDESVYPERHAAAKKTLGRVAKEKGGKVGFQSTTYKDGKRVTTHGHYNEKGERVVTHTTKEEVELDERNIENKAKKNAAVSAIGAKHKDDQHLEKRGMRASVADKIRGREVTQGKDRKQHNEEVTQVDELSRETKNAYLRKADKQVGVTMNQRPAKKIGGIGYANLHKIKNRKAGIKQAMKEEQMDEVLDSPMKKISYIMKAKKSIEKSDPKKIKQANDIANRTIGIKRVMNKINKKD